MSVATHCPYCALQCGMHLVERARRPDRPGQRTVSGEQRRTVRQGLDRGGDARASGSPARAARPRHRRPLAAGHLGRGARRDRRRIQPDPAPPRTRRGRRLRQRLADEREGVPARQVRARRARHVATSTTTAASACRRRRRPANRAFGIDRGLPFPLDDIPRRRRRSCWSAATPPRRCRRSCSTSRRSSASGGTLIVADPRRTATAQWATLHLQLTPGTDAALANGLLHVLIRDGLDRRGLHRGAHRRLRRGAARGRRPTGRSGSSRSPAFPKRDSSRPRARSAGAGRAMVLTARGPEQQAQGVDNALAFINIALALGQVGQPVRRIRLPHRTGQRPGRARARAEGRPAPRLSPIDDPTRAAARRRRLGRAPERLPGPRQLRLRAARPLGRDGGIRALLVFGSNSRSRRPTRCASSERLRALDLLVVADFFLSETAALADVVLPAAQWAEEDGTMTNLEGPRHPPAAARVAPPTACAPTSRSSCALAARLGVRRAVSVRAQPRRLRRAAAGDARRRRRLLRDHLRRASTRRTACSGPARTPTIRARRACSPTAFPTPSGRARFHAVAAPRAGGGARRRLTRCTSPPAASSRTTSPAPRPGASPSCSDAAPEPFAEMHPRTARPAGIARRRPRHADDAARLGHLPREADADDPRGHASSCRSTGAAMQSANRLTNPALDPIEPDARVQGLRRSTAASAGSARTPDDRRRLLVVIGNGMAGARFVEELVARGGREQFDIVGLRRRTVRQLQPDPAVERARRQPSTRATSSSTRSSWYARRTASRCTRARGSMRSTSARRSARRRRRPSAVRRRSCSPPAAGVRAADARAATPTRHRSSTASSSSARLEDCTRIARAGADWPHVPS